MFVLFTSYSCSEELLSTIEEIAGEDIANQLDPCPEEDEENVRIWGNCYRIENVQGLGWGGACFTTGNGDDCYDDYTDDDDDYRNPQPARNDSIPSSIGKLKNLEYMNLHQFSITGSIPSEIGNLSELKHINLDGNFLTGSLPPEMGNLSNLTTLNLKENALTGSIPSELGNLGNLSNELKLQHNQFSGEIPGELGDLNSLKRVYLQSNQLTGEIPPTLFNIGSLEMLDLRSNELTGHIPQEYCTNYGGEIRLGNNKLCAPYPSCFYEEDGSDSWKIREWVGYQDDSDCPVAGCMDENACNFNENAVIDYYDDSCEYPDINGDCPEYD